ncbi:MAG: hypothetical protein M1592_05305 [Candidatus Thermoplasmatota archaeon]|nr:hypothetical protein [Candidatus Thermoplasmatota archaeon]
MRYRIVIGIILSLVLLAVSLSYHFYSTSHLPPLPRNKKQSSQNSTLTESPLIGPKLLVNLVAPDSGEMNIQIFGSKYLGSTVYYLLNATVYSNGNYNYLLSDSFYNLSESYVNSGFGKGNTASLTAMASYDDQSGGSAGYNNIDFNPYAINIVHMEVKGNLTYLDNWFKDTGFNPGNYDIVSFINSSLKCDL